MTVSNHAKRFLTAFALSALICVATAGVMNYFVDPAKLFDTTNSTEKEIALLLHQGNVGGVKNYDERLTQKYRLQLEAAQPKEFLVIGSSRSMQIGADVMQASVLNLSVSGASIEDYVAILDLARNFPAKIIILGVDPWIFNSNSGQTGWRSLAIDYLQGFDRLTKSHKNASLARQVKDENAWRKLVQIFNLEYTKASLLSLLARRNDAIKSKPFRKPDDAPEIGFDAIRMDGSRIYNLAQAKVSKDEAKERAVFYALSQPIYALQAFTSINSEKMMLFEKLVERLKENSEVWLFLPPYHPEAYKSIVSKVPMVREAENVLRSLAENTNIQIFGSYDPDRASCTEDEFFDGMHPKASCLMKIFFRPG